MCRTLTRLARSSWRGSGRERGEEEGTRGRKEGQGKGPTREVKRAGQPRGVKEEMLNPCHLSQNQCQRRGRRVEEVEYKFCYFPEEGIVMGNPGGEDGSPISVVSALRLTRYYTHWQNSISGDCHDSFPVIVKGGKI